MTDITTTATRFASFDLETATPIDPFEKIKISCAAVALEDNDIRIWQGIPHMTRAECAEMVGDFLQIQKDGYTFLTWNGCAFDFRVLAQCSSMTKECAQLAKNHVDMMLLVTFRKGWRLGLEAALQGAELSGKLKTVTLSTGAALDGMDGNLAPELWAAGEYDAVLEYLKEDVLQPLALAKVIQETKVIKWTSGSGRPQRVFVNTMTTVTESMLLPRPDTSWMTDPPTRESFVEWLPGGEGDDG